MLSRLLSVLISLALSPSLTPLSLCLACTRPLFLCPPLLPPPLDPSVLSLVPSLPRLSPPPAPPFSHTAGHEHPLTQLIRQQGKQHVSKSVSDLVEEDEEAALEGLGLALQKMSPGQRKALVEKLLA